MTRSSLVTAVLIAATLVAAARFGAAVYKAPAPAQGDFRASLPGGYARLLNPTLWNSDDLIGSLGYQRDLYVYGPTQYLLLYPIVFLDSYTDIARLLGFVYAGVLACALYLLSRLVAGSPWSANALLAVAAVSLMFSPFSQTYIQREFEVVVFFLLVAATLLLVSRHDGWAGAILGVITWFKLWPVVFLGYFLAKKQFKAAAAFALASCLTLGAAQFLFGLDRFVIFMTASDLHRPSLVKMLIAPLGGVPGFRAGGGEWFGTGFCVNWYSDEQTAVGIPWAVCRLAFSHPSFPAVFTFYGLSALAGAGGLLGLILFDRRQRLTEEERRWGILVEISLVTIAGALVLSAHYYYFIYLTLPLSALAYRYGRDRRWIKLNCLVLAYVLLAAFLLPISVMSRLFGVDFWRFYAEHVIYLYGELILIALLLSEYIAIGLRHPDEVSALASKPRQRAGEVFQ